MKNLNNNILYILFSLTTFLLTPYSLFSSNEINHGQPLKLGVKDAISNKATTKSVNKKSSPSIKLIRLEQGVNERVNDDTENNPDITFRVNIPASGIYTLKSYVERLDTIIRGVRVETRNAKLQINNQRVTRRIVSNSFSYDIHNLGFFKLSEGEQSIKIWLPEQIAFEALEIQPHIEDTVPSHIANYVPEITPHISRPRLWVTQESLPLVKERLTHGENLPVWTDLQKEAKTDFHFDYNPRKETFHLKDLEESAQAKAFYYLMTDDKKIGKEAVQLMTQYLSVLEFGNVKHGDITREIGRAIYTAALVYDWCYNLMSEKEKNSLYSDMMRLAMDMEIGWPPFKDVVVNGHASEAQVNRDLLSMAIAIYDEDPEPYKYISYLLLEELIPMRAFEYQSPRHNQGIDYGAYRHAWEMHAAWILYRMTGAKVFKDNITNLKNYWLYMRLPNGELFRDGDVFSNSQSYWKSPITMFLDYTYDNDPIVKAELERQGGLKNNPLLFLLLNNPALKPDYNLASLPLSLNFGNVLGGLIARTGWNIGEDSNNVVAEIKGGGYHFGNHQHADAGAIQIYYRGAQVCDLGIYSSYGIPYDLNFNKRSVAHSMMLVKDPNEELLFRSKINDGGTRFNQATPSSPKETTTNPWFDYGTVLSVDYEPSTTKPSYSYFKVDLTAAYSAKVSNYTRSFCFLNMNREDIPAIIILADDITSSKKGFNKYWKVNTLNQPSKSDSGFIIQNSQNGLIGKTHINVLLPSINDRDIEISSLRDSSSVLGPQYQINKRLPEANGYQAIIYPKENKEYNRFLTVFQMANGETVPLQVNFQEEDGKYYIRIADRIVCMSSDDKQIQTSFTIDVTQEESLVLFTDMKPGFWNISNGDKTIDLNTKIETGKNTTSFRLPRGKYFVNTGRTYTDIKSRIQPQ